MKKSKSKDLFTALHSALSAVSSFKSALAEVGPDGLSETEVEELKLSVVELCMRSSTAFEATLKQSFHPWDSDMDTMKILAHVCAMEGVSTILEIGTNTGATSRYLHGHDFIVTTCDPNDSILADLKKKVEFIHGTIDDVPKKKYDAAFIDGDHSLKAVAYDFKRCEEMDIKLMFLHDCYGIEGVKQFCEQQLSNPHYQGLMIHTHHASGNENGLAIFKRR